ncbi:MAG: hypothetical protein AB9869_33695 [Verrucomicrobiia bacterium]
MELVSRRFAAQSLADNPGPIRRPPWTWADAVDSGVYSSVSVAGKTIFLVHQSPSPGSPLKAALEERGYSVIHGASVSEALRLWVRFAGRVHLFLADINLGSDPRIEELVRSLQARNPRMRVLFANDLEQPAGARMVPQAYSQQLVGIVDNCLA